MSWPENEGVVNIISAHGCNYKVFSVASPRGHDNLFVHCTKGVEVR